MKDGRCIKCLRFIVRKAHSYLSTGYEALGMVIGVLWLPRYLHIIIMVDYWRFPDFDIALILVILCLQLVI